jgi:PGF-CTERM protein
VSSWLVLIVPSALADQNRAIRFLILPRTNAVRTFIGLSQRFARAHVMMVVATAGVMVNNAKVIKADIKASNGVVHVIDAVILPPVAAKAAVAIGTAAAVAGKAEETTKKAEETAKQAEATTQKSTPGFEGIFAIAGLLSVAFVAYRRRD